MGEAVTAVSLAIALAFAGLSFWLGRKLGGNWRAKKALEARRRAQAGESRQVRRARERRGSP